MDIDELLELKEQINNAKKNKNMLEGKKQQLMETLEKDFECRSVRQAEKKKDEFEKELVKLKEDVDNKRNKLEEVFNKGEKND